LSLINLNYTASQPASQPALMCCFIAILLLTGTHIKQHNDDAIEIKQSNCATSFQDFQENNVCCV
ncbi:hypothetical protein DOY81_006387, partial [Sarcophaga bullata]